MGKVWFQLSVSLDGFSAGPHQSEKDPIGVGGMKLFDWQFALEAWRRLTGQEGGESNASTPVFQEALSNYGAVVMGRNMFGGGPGPWSADRPWSGWWGDEPPYHTPVFVLTHHARDPLSMKGETTFFFVTDGIESALKQAQHAAGSENVLLGGGPNVVQQYLAAGLVDEFELHLVPVILGGGERLLEAVGTPELGQMRVIEAPGVTHIKYRVARRPLQLTQPGQGLSAEPGGGQDASAFTDTPGRS